MTTECDQDLGWVRSQITLLDKVIADGMDRYAQQPGVRDDDHRAALKDLSNLKYGKDCHYDAPSIGFWYAAVYHGKRTQQAFSALYGSIEKSIKERESISILDLGAGTGSTLWGAALVLLSMSQRGIRFRERLRIVECDSSPFMLRQGEFLWKELCMRHPVLEELIDRKPPQYHSWDRIELPDAAKTWIVASYLLHASDTSQPKEQAADDEVSGSIARIADRHNASKVVVWQSNSKQPAMKRALGKLQQQEWRADESIRPLEKGFTRERAKMKCVRDTAGQMCADVESPGYWYSDYPPNVLVYTRQMEGKLFAYEPLPSIHLDEQQARIRDQRPKHALIQGAAGSGKTVLLAARILDFIQSQNGKALFSTYNIKVIQSVAKLLEEGAVGGRVDIARDGDSRWQCRNKAGSAEVLAMTFDKLPWHGHFKAVSGYVKHKRGCNCKACTEIDCFSGGRDFVWDEFELILYGRCEGKLEDYLIPAYRRGRGRAGSLDEQQKRAIHSKLVGAFGPLGNTGEHPQTFCHARYALLERLRSRPLPENDRFAHIIVDEGQDFTRTDWKIIKSLARTDAAWTICWDRTQAIRTGSTFDSFRGVVSKLKDVRNTKLVGAYRVPRPVSKFANLLVSMVPDGDMEHAEDEQCLELSPKMHAVPGPRPLIVYGKDHCGLVENVVRHLEIHAEALPVLRKGPSLAAEMRWCDVDLAVRIRKRLQQHGWEGCQSSTVLATKGIEFDTVVWCADTPLYSDDRSIETIFTILTRTRHLLVIAFSDAIQARALEFLRHAWDPKHRDLARWTPEAKQYMEHVCSKSGS